MSFFEVVELIFIHVYSCAKLIDSSGYLEGSAIIFRMAAKKDVVYFFDEMVGTYHYAFAHPMKPLRVAMTD